MSEEKETITAPIAATFFSGWRPAIGWIIVGGYGLQFILIPIANIYLTITGRMTYILPNLDVGPLLALTGATLGLGGLRTMEKIKDAREDK